jgi:hypothetical protein
VGNEVSSRGYNGFMAYYDYIQAVSERFMRFYIDKKFYSNHAEIESFIKGEENVFYSEGSLPANFWTGIFVTFIYINLLIIALYVKHKKKYAFRKAGKPHIEFGGVRNILFVLCGDTALKDDVFQYYRARGDASCLSKINTNDFQFNVGVKETLNHLREISGVDKQKASGNLELLGIQNPGPESPGHDDILKLYTAVKTAADHEYIVMDDFLKGESRRFEVDFFRLIAALDAAGKKLVFLSTEMYYPAESLNEKISVEKFGVFPVCLDKITLR